MSSAQEEAKTEQQQQDATDAQNQQPEQINSGQQETEESIIAPLEDLKKLFSRVKDSLLRSSTSVEAILEAQNLVSILSAQTIAGTSPLSAEQSKFFYEEFFKEICTRAANCESTHGPTQEAVAELLRSLIDLLAAELRMQTPTCLDLADKMKPVFSTESKLYTNAFQKVSGTQATSSNDLNGSIPESDLNAEERAWRLSLEKDMDVDVLKRDDKKRLEMWSKGKIVSVTGLVSDLATKRLTIKYWQDVGVAEGQYCANSRYLAPYGTLSNVQSWRDQLKKGDLVDALDKYDQWNTATVIWIDSRDEATTTMYMVRIGFRQYNEEGDKEDKNGKYHGFSEQMDEYIGIQTCRIQKPYTQTTLKDLEGNSVAMTPATILALQQKNASLTTKAHDWENIKIQDEKDMKMITQEGQIMCAIEREGTCTSQLLIELLVRFFEAHGFAHILSALCNPDTPLKAVHDLAMIVSGCYPLYHKSFVDAYLEGFKIQVEAKLESADEQQLKMTRFSTIEEIVDMLWIKVMSRKQPDTQRQIGKYQLLTKLGILFLKQKFVQKRIDGATAIDMVCKRALSQRGAVIKDTIKKEESDVVKTLLTTLQEADIINLYFNRANIHEEQVKRAGGILSLFLNQEALSEDQINFIWSSCSDDTLYRALIQDCLKDLTSHVSPLQLVSIIERVCMTPKKRIKEDEIDLVMSLCYENVYNAEDAPIVKLNQNRVLDFYWEYLTDESSEEYLNKVIANKAMFNFMDVLKSLDKERTEFYFDKIQQEMRQNNASAFICIKIAHRIFKETKVTNKDNVPVLADKMQEKHQLMQLIIEELHQYSAKVNEQVTLKMQQAEASGKPFDDSKLHEDIYSGVFTHQEQITERIEFLTIFAQECATKLQKDSLAQLWIALVDNNQIKFDKKQLFSMLKNFVDVALADSGNKVINLEDLSAFYRECIAQGLSDYTNLEIEGFVCIQGFFILINHQQNRMTILNDANQVAAGKADQPKSILKNAGKGSDKVTSISSDGGAVKQQLDFQGSPAQIDTSGTQTQATGETGNSAITDSAFIGPKPPTAAAKPSIANKDGKINLMMNVAPSELEGTAGLWRIAAQAENGKVNEAVVNLLLQIHTHLDPALQDRLSEFEDLYINQCIEIIEANLDIIARRTPDDKAAIVKAIGLTEKKKFLVSEKRISNAFRSLTNLIKNSESEGTYGLISHRAFAQDTIVKDIEVTNEFNYEANSGYAKSFKIDLKSNMNLFQVKKMICEKLAFKEVDKIQEIPPHPSAVKLVLKRYIDRPIKDTENGMLISELFLRAKERILVSPRGSDDILNMSLLEPDTNKLTSKARAACRILFEKFAIATPEAPDLLFLSTDLVKELTEKVSDKASLRPSSILAYNTNEDVNKLLYTDFLNYYEQMATENPEMVRANLQYIGIRSDMKTVPNPGDSDDILNIHKSPNEMPRFKIANNQRCFRALLTCLDLEPDTKRDANELIMQVCTNQRILGNVLEVGPTMFGWENVSSGEGAKEVVYTLTMVEQILYNSDDSDMHQGSDQSEAQTAMRQLKKTWITRFLQSGGLNKLIAMMEKGLLELQQLRKEAEPDADPILKLKEVLTVTMKIVKVFVSATVCGSRNDTNADLFSIKQSTSALSKRLQQGSITSIITHKQLRRADKGEIDLEDRLEKSCAAKSSPNAFFGVLAPSNKAKTTPSTTSQNEKASDKPKQDFKPDDITEDFLFGGDVTYDGQDEPPAQQKTETDEQKTETDDQPQLLKQQSKETKPVDKERIHFLEVTDRYKQIAEQISTAIKDPTFGIAIDFDRLHDFCLEATASCIFSQDKQLTHERTLIHSALDVWSACVIYLDRPLKWERKAENIEETTVVHNLNDLICQALTCNMPEVRRFFYQDLTLVCEQLSQEKHVEPFTMVCDVLLNHLNNVSPAARVKLSEELYETLGDACFAKYYIQRSIKKEGREIEPSELKFYKEALVAMIGAIKNHESFIGNEQQENLVQAKAFESLMLATADIFSFYNKQESYDVVFEFLTEHKLIDYIFYEVLFFVPGKTQCINRNKAKRMETRKAAFQLLFKILKFLRPQDFLGFLTTQFEPMAQVVPRPTSWDHQPSERVRKSDEQIGINNLGNVCYMISMLQQFYWVPAFRYGLLKVIDESPPNMVEYKERMIDDNMLRQLQLLFGHLELSERAMVDPTEFCFSFKQFDGQPTNTGVQRDAQEFLNEFFDNLEKLLKNTSQEHLLADIFQGTTVQQKVCQSCKFVKRSTQPYYTQTLYVENNNDVYESLQKQLEGDMIDGYRCEACNQSVNLQNQQILGKLPNVLILHLQRISFDYNSLELKKKTNKFEFPMLLNLSKYSCKNNIDLSEEEKNDPANKEILEMMSYEDEDFVYRLTGVCIHRGRANSGHYWSLIHLKRGDQEPDPAEDEAKWADVSLNWREFNDEKVSFFFAKNIGEQGYGGYMTEAELKTYAGQSGEDWSKSAYMLVYERKLKTELRQVVRDEQAESVDMVKFNAMPKEIPTWIEEAIKTDNRAHVADTQIFHPLFFAFSAQLLKHCTAELLDQEADFGPEQKQTFHGLQQMVMSIGHKLSFDLLSHFKDVDSTKSICSSLRSVFSWSDPVKEFGLCERPSLLHSFIKKVLHEDKCEYFFKVMYDSHSSSTVRDQIGRTMCRVVTKAIKVVVVSRNDPARKDLPVVAELQTMLVDILRKIFGILKDRQFQQKWNKLKEYFEALSDIGIDDKYQAEFLLVDFNEEGKDDIITSLCDFMLQQKSPNAVDEMDARVEMGGSYNKPAFGHLVSMVSHLVKSSWTKNSSEEQTTFAKHYRKDENAKVINMMDKKIDLSDKALEFFTNSDLFELILSCDYHVLDYARALAHVCYGNAELSRKVCKMAIECRYEGTSSNYLKVLRHQLKLQDTDAKTGEKLQLKRLEWVFGCPQPSYSTLGVSDTGLPAMVGLASFGFDIDSEAFTYKTALNPDSEDDNVSVLQLLLKSYNVANLASEQATGMPQKSQKLAASVPSQAQNESGLGESSLQEQLRAQGMPEDQMNALLTQMGEDPQNKAQLEPRTRSKSDADVPSFNPQIGVKVDSYLDLEPLEYLMRMVANDENSMGFFADLPGFTYQYNRYTDWIGQYLAAIQAQIQKDSKSLTNDQKSCFRAIQTLFVKYISFIESLDEKKSEEPKEDSNNTMMIDTTQKAAAKPSQPFNYMILKVVDSSDSGLLVESNGLNLTATRLRCAFVESKPNGATNKGVAQSLLNRFGTKQAKQGGGSAGGDQDQAAPDNSSQKTDNQQAQEQGGAVGASNSNYQEPDQMTDLKVDLDDPAVQHALTTMVGNPEYMWIFELSEEEKLQCLENMFKEVIYDGVKQYYKDQAPKTEVKAQVAEPAAPAEENKAAQEPKDEDMVSSDPFEGWEGEPIQECEDLVYVLTVSNTSDQPLNYTISFKDGATDSVANLRWPKQGLVGAIGQNEAAKIVAVLAKKDTEGEISVLNEVQKLQVELIAKVDESKLKKESGAAGGNGGAVGNGGTNESKHDVSIGGDALGLMANEKECGACTMYNSIDATECYMCQTKFQD